MDLEAAAASRSRAYVRAVCVGDRLDDGEAEPDTVAETLGVGVESLEGMEEFLDFAGRDQRAGVRDRENGTPRFEASCDLDAAVHGVVADRVRDEVGDETLEQVAIAARAGPLERKDALEPAQVMRSQRLGRNRREVDRLAVL
jgi:hypothetical protein